MTKRIFATAIAAAVIGNIAADRRCSKRINHCADPN